MPVVTSWVVVSFIFKYLYNQQGLSNYILNDLLHFIPENISWLTNPKTALWAIMILGIWKGIGWTMVIYLGGLAGIPRELYEAAKVDGAGKLKRFLHITLPLLKPSILIALIFRSLVALQVFDVVFAMTRGGPGYSTETLVYNIYRQTFVYSRFGYGSALSVLLSIIIFTLGFFYILLLYKSERIL